MNEWKRGHEQVFGGKACDLVLCDSYKDKLGILLTQRGEWFHTSSLANKKCRGNAVSQFDPNRTVRVTRGVDEAGFENLRRLFGR